MSNHSRFAPSSMARIVSCPGSLKLCEQYPQAPSDAADEGTLSHEVIAAVYLGKPIPAGATEEMRDGAELWMETVGVHSGLRSIHVEEFVDCSVIYRDCWGTPDLWAYDHNSHVLYVYDYKYGHSFVAAYQNWQLIAYAMGILDNPLLGPVEQIVCTIVQPRNYHSEGMVRSYVIAINSKNRYLDHLKEACRLADQGGSMCITGASCRHCPARHVCQALQSSNYDIAQYIGQALPFELTDQALGYELTRFNAAQDVLKARTSGLELEVVSRINRGASIPGWSMKQAQGRQKWTMPVAEVITLGVLMGIDVSKPGAITPKQAIKAGLPKELVADYSESHVGAVELVADNGRNASLIFKGE